MSFEERRSTSGIYDSVPPTGDNTGHSHLFDNDHPATKTLLIKPGHSRYVYCKSFGAFYGKYCFEGQEQLFHQYQNVCLLNKWTPSRFKTYSSMIKWLRSNNAPDWVIENIYEMAYVHQFHQIEDWCSSTYNTETEIEFLREKYALRTSLNDWCHPHESDIDPDQEF